MICILNRLLLRSLLAAALVGWLAVARTALSQGPAEQASLREREIAEAAAQSNVDQIGASDVVGKTEASEVAGSREARRRIDMRTSTYAYLLPRSYFLFPPLMLKGADYGLEKRNQLPFAFEARIAPHIFVYTSLPELGSKDGFAQAFSLSPEVVLRMWRTVSEPVRTPSYRPTLTWQGFIQRLEVNPDGVPLRGVVYVPKIYLGHYSNGQDGCTYETAQPVENTEGCEVVRSKRRRTNKRNGDFSTNRLGAALGAIRLFKFDKGVLLPTLTFAGELGAEVNLSDTPGGISDDLRWEYGWGTFHGLTEVEWIPNTAKAPWLGPKRVTAQLRYAAFTGGRVPYRSGLEGTLAGTLLRADGFGLLARFYYGYDYYNVSFDQKILQLALGIVWSGMSAQRFETR